MNENDMLVNMINDHCKIENLLDNLEVNIDKEFREFEKSFIIFKNKLEKHIFIEEKVIFSLYNPKNVSEGYKMLPELIKQHNYMLNTINNFSKFIFNKKKIEGFYEFKNFLIKHRKFEEKELYSQLDKELNDKQKKYIFNKISRLMRYE